VAAEVGSAFISIRPSMVGFHKQIAKDLKTLGPQVKKIGLDLGHQLGDGIKKGIGDPLSGPLEESTKKQRSKAPKQGEQTAGAFASGFEKRLKAAFASLPKAEIKADSSEADKEIAKIRARLETLSGQRVGVDINSKEALTRIGIISERIQRLSADSADVQVRVDTAVALTELAAIQAEVDHLDHDDVNIKVDADTRGAVAGLAAVGTSLAAVSIGLAGVAAIPIGATIGAGILSLIGPLGAAGAGFAGLAAVAVPAISDVSGALKAQEAAQKAATGTAAQAKAANDKLAASLKALSPAERDLYKSWVGLKSAFTDWSRSLQPAVLPLFTRGVNLLKQALPSLTPIVRGAAGAVDGLLGKVQAAAKSPFWQQLKTNVTALTPTAITGFGTAAGNVATGLAGVVNAFLPYAPAILGFITRITGQFANWGKGLGASNGFSKFIDYAKQNAPLILKTVKELAGAFTNIVTSLAPLGPGILGGFGLLLRFVGALKPGEIQAIAIAFTLLSVGIWAVNFALEANPIVLVVVAIVALVAAVVLAFNHVGWFHDAVVGAWNGIKTAALFVWNSVLKPIFTALVVAVKAVSTAALWLWHNVLVPAFNAISLAARILFAVVAVAVLAPLVIAFNLVKAAALFLWHNAIVPTFNGIKVAALAAWTLIKPLLAFFMAGLRAVGSAGLWLWHHAIVPALSGIKTAITTVWNTVIHPVLNAINSVIRNVIAPVFRWIWNSVIKPVWSAVGAGIKVVWDNVIRPTFDALKRGVTAVKNGFKVAVDAITKIWKGIESATKKPVQFVVNTVYNNGIRSVWNQVAGLVHLPSLPTVKFATGGIFPGYTPGRDPYQMPMAAFSGGEAVMRPEFTRAVGSDFVYAANRVARQRGPDGVRNFLANGDLKFARGGVMPGAPVQRFSFGGILDAVKHASSLVVHGASSLLDGGASAFAKHALGSILGKIPGADSTFAKAVFSLPKRMIDGFIGWLKKAIDPKLGGDALGVVAQAKKFVGIGDDRGPNNNMWTRAWGMPGAPWCAMFVSDMIKRAGATKHYPGYPTAAVAGYNGRMRHVSTGSGQAGDLGVYGGGAHINIIAGKKGGAYDTYGGNQNALVQHKIRGGQTSVLRPAFAYGGILGRQAQRVFKYEAPNNADPHELQTPLVRLMRSLPAGQMGSVARAIVNKHLNITNAGVYDNGGVIPPGLSLVANASRKPEAILNDAQWSAITRAGSTSEGTPLIGTVVQQLPAGASPEEFFEELNFGLRRTRRGGVYAHD
jgi:hypothetical protein